MPARQQFGIVLIAAILGFILVAGAMRGNQSYPVQRLGYDLPSAVYPERPSESTNKFRISLVPNENLQEIRVRTYWLRSRGIPNSTRVLPVPTSDYVSVLSSMVSEIGPEPMLEFDISYDGSPATAYLYDFNPVLRVLGTNLEESPTCFAFIVDLEDSVVGYYEGLREFFPFPEKTVFSLRVRGIGGTEVYAPSSAGQEKVTLAHWEPEPGVWAIVEPVESHIEEIVVLLSEDARLYLEKNWGSSPRRMQLTLLEVDGEHHQTWYEFT